MVGSIRYSGILSVYSGKKDMSGLDQDGERQFFNFQMLDDNSLDFEYEAAARESSIPDIRNLLYWEPSIEFSEKGTYRVNFSTPDTPGQYVLTIRGTDPVNGTNMLEKALFLVK